MQNSFHLNYLLALLLNQLIIDLNTVDKSFPPRPQGPGRACGQEPLYRRS